MKGRENSIPLKKRMKVKCVMLSRACELVRLVASTTGFSACAEPFAVGSSRKCVSGRAM